MLFKKLTKPSHYPKLRYSWITGAQMNKLKLTGKTKRMF